MNKRDYKYMIMTAGLTAAWIILLFFAYTDRSQAVLPS